MTLNGTARRPKCAFVVAGLSLCSLVACALPGYDFTSGGGAASGGNGATGTGSEGGVGASGTGASGAAGGAGTGGAGADGGSGGAQSYFGECPGSAMLPASSAVFDDFSSEAVSQGKWLIGGIASFDNDALVLSPTSTEQWAAASSVLDVSLTSCAIQAEVLAVLAGSFDDTSLAFMGPNDEELAMFTQGSVLFVYLRPDVNLPPEEITIGNLDLQTHRYWRIQERSGDVLFSTSADGATWKQEASFNPTPDWVTHGYVRVSTWLNANSSASARFDNVNVPPP